MSRIVSVLALVALLGSVSHAVADNRFCTARPGFVPVRAIETAPASTAADAGCPAPEQAPGDTVLHFVVLADGSVSGVKLEKSSGNSCLDDAAVKTLSAQKYKPASFAGEPLACPVATSFTWTVK